VRGRAEEALRTEVMLTPRRPDVSIVHPKAAILMSGPTARWLLVHSARSLYRRLAFVTEAAGVIVKAVLALSFRPRPKRSTPAGESRNGRTLLIVSYYSPPYKSIYGTQRIAKFAKYLSRLGWRIVFVTTNPRSGREEDVFDDPLPPEVEVTRIAPVHSHPFWGKNQIPPDDFVLWIPEAVEAIGKILGRTQVSVILATVPPYSNAVAAAICAKRFDVPLVTDFRDPWTRVDFYWGLKRAWARRVSARLERLVLRASARIVMADQLEDFAEYFADTTPAMRTKTVSILNGYDESDFDGTEEAARRASSERAAGKFVVSYVGSLYAREVASLLLGAFDAWRALSPGDLAHAVFEYAGGQSSYLEGGRNLPLEFKDHGFVSHKQAIAIRAGSDLQLFALPPSVKPHWLSGKIYEMIRARVPILAFASSRGAAAELLRLTGAGTVIEPDDLEGAGRALKQLYDEWVMHGKIARQSGSVAVEEFSRRALAARLDNVLREVAGR